MAVFQKDISLSTRGRCDVLNITDEVARIVTASGIRTGMVNVSGVGSTLGITTLEFEPGCVADLKRALESVKYNEPHPPCWRRLANTSSEVKSGEVASEPCIRLGTPMCAETWQSRF